MLANALWKAIRFIIVYSMNINIRAINFFFSDGLGFSGVYIALDIGIKSHEESKTSVVDMFELSKNLRRDRHGIVCTLEHYNFIYQVSKITTFTYCVVYSSVFDSRIHVDLIFCILPP